VTIAISEFSADQPPWLAFQKCHRERIGWGIRIMKLRAAGLFRSEALRTYEMHDLRAAPASRLHEPKLLGPSHCFGTAGQRQFRAASRACQPRAKSKTSVCSACILLGDVSNGLSGHLALGDSSVNRRRNSYHSCRPCHTRNTRFSRSSDARVYTQDHASRHVGQGGRYPATAAAIRLRAWMHSA